MVLQKKPFVKYNLEQSRDNITISLNKEEREILEDSKKLLHQEKDSTALKQLAFIGSKALHSPETEYILDVVYSNKRKNKRLGINTF